jgi:hypothetical protein
MWAFIHDPTSRALLSWLGGGMVVVVSGVWAAFKYWNSKSKNAAQPPTVTADRGGIAAGRDVRGTITTSSATKIKSDQR